jgi:hypothetical protein
VDLSSLGLVREKGFYAPHNCWHFCARHIVVPNPTVEYSGLNIYAVHAAQSARQPTEKPCWDFAPAQSFAFIAVDHAFSVPED